MHSGNHYVAQVKKNQKTLYEDMEIAALEQKAISEFRESERAKGMTIIRETTVFEASDRKKAKEWEALSSYIKVERTFVKKDVTTSETAYFISDLQLHANEFHKGVRGHWGIENRLHWVKDVNHGEDNNKITKGNGPVNVSIFSSIAINIHRKTGSASVSHAQMEYAAHLKDHINIIRT